jgi:hypothetical protein
MADEARRLRQQAKRDRPVGWRLVLRGNPTGPATAGSDNRSARRRLATGWPRRLYLEVEQRWSHAPSEPLLRGLLLIGYLVLAGLVGTVVALVALAAGKSAATGFTVGVGLCFGLLALAVGYLCWGGLVDWWSRRDRPKPG